MNRKAVALQLDAADHNSFKAFAENVKNALKDTWQRNEASNLTTLANNLKEFPHILVPLPVLDYSTRSVLTMDYVSGIKVTASSPIAQMDINGDVLAE
jgi:predicted unusual protein kinase regulating ubiquinone biosynthesis (AarF/ABC1/UbiB family)